MDPLDLAIERYRANPTPQNHDALSLQQTLAWYRAKTLAALEDIWERA